MADYSKWKGYYENTSQTAKNYQNAPERFQKGFTGDESEEERKKRLEKEKSDSFGRLKKMLSNGGQ